MNFLPFFLQNGLVSAIKQSHYFCKVVKFKAKTPKSGHPDEEAQVWTRQTTQAWLFVKKVRMNTERKKKTKQQLFFGHFKCGLVGLNLTVTNCCLLAQKELFEKFHVENGNSSDKL